jgi:hypothetical protein
MLVIIGKTSGTAVRTAGIEGRIGETDARTGETQGDPQGIAWKMPMTASRIAATAEKIFVIGEKTSATGGKMFATNEKTSGIGVMMAAEWIKSRIGGIVGKMSGIAGRAVATALKIGRTEEKTGWIEKRMCGSTSVNSVLPAPKARLPEVTDLAVEGAGEDKRLHKGLNDRVLLTRPCSFFLGYTLDCPFHHI